MHWTAISIGCMLMAMHQMRLCNRCHCKKSHWLSHCNCNIDAVLTVIMVITDLLGYAIKPQIDHCVNL